MLHSFRLGPFVAIRRGRLAWLLKQEQLLIELNSDEYREHSDKYGYLWRPKSSKPLYRYPDLYKDADAPDA